MTSFYSLWIKVGRWPLSDHCQPIQKMKDGGLAFSHLGCNPTPLLKVLCNKTCIKMQEKTQMSSWCYFCFETGTFWSEKMFNECPELAHHMLTMKHLTLPIEVLSLGRLGTSSPIWQHCRMPMVASGRGHHTYRDRREGSRVSLAFSFSGLRRKSHLSSKENNLPNVHNHRMWNLKNREFHMTKITQRHQNRLNIVTNTGLAPSDWLWKALSGFTDFLKDVFLYKWRKTLGTF